MGIDPAAAMLDIARAKPNGERVTWIVDDARSAHLGRTFDLVLLTGHAFQVFLTPSDQLSVLRTIAAHLNSDGRFIFDSRNPLAEEWRGWTREKTLPVLLHPHFGEVDAWHTARYAAGTNVATYETHYAARTGAHTFSAQSQIRFAPQNELAAAIAEAGLTVDHWFGDWRGAPFVAASPEIIPLGRLAH